jgi:hypothetical protein
VLERVLEEKSIERIPSRTPSAGTRTTSPKFQAGSREISRRRRDFSPVGGEPYRTPSLKTRKEILDFFDANVATARKAIAAVKDEEMPKMWTLLNGGEVIITMPRAAVIRTFIINHLIHHRAILCVYLRLNDIPVPGMYGPSGDE